MTEVPALSAEDIVSLLGLEPHPEGGFYRETFRDSHNRGGRAASTAIYFLLRQGEVSRWHRIDSAEVWHWYAGAALELAIAEGRGPAARVLLGPNLLAGERPQAVVPPERWQQARSLGSWTLVGCTVAPGFTFDRFEIAAPGAEPQE
jgi:predicted cupin superfamily sugar epimerase